jgi:hypothetical protein
MRLSRLVAFALTSAVAFVPFGVVNAADPVVPNPYADCAAPFSATKVDADPNVVVLRAVDLPGPFSGTITAYGADTMWTGTIDHAAVTDMRYGGRETSLNVRADRPIEGIAYAPAGAHCTFHAGTRPREGYEARDVDRPTLTVGNPQPVEPAPCARPYVAAFVKSAFEPRTPANADGGGVVRVAVGLDAFGLVRYTRVVASPSVRLNPSAVDAARRSEYGAAVFRCKSVPSGYQFAVEYPP